MKKRKVSNFHKSPAPPQLLKFVVAALFEIRYAFSLVLGGVWETHPPPPPPNPLLWGKGEEGIIIFDVLNTSHTYYSQEQNMSQPCHPHPL
jgi:hypothetical protein